MFFNMRKSKKTNTRKTIIAMSIAALLSGCANQQNLTGSKAGDMGLLGGGIGAGIGTLIAQTTGLPPVAGAFVGGALGAGVGYYIGKNQDLELAEANAQKWKQQGFNTQVTSSATPPQEPFQKEQGQAQEQKLDRVEIEIPAKLLTSKSAALDDLLRDAGKMSITSKYRYLYKIEAKSQKDGDYILSKIKNGAAPREVISSFSKSAGPSKLIMEVLSA